MGKYDSLRRRSIPSALDNSSIPVVRASEATEGEFPAFGEDTDVFATYTVPDGDEALPLPEMDEALHESPVLRLAEPPPAMPSAPVLTPPEKSSAVARSLQPQPPGSVRPVSALEQEVRALLSLGRVQDAMHAAEEACEQAPEEEEPHLIALKVAAKVGSRSAIVRHAEWLMTHLFRLREYDEACAVFRGVVEHRNDLPWTERGLVTLVLAADSIDDPLLVAQATRKLMRGYPQSKHLAGACLKTGEHQARSGRTDLARATFAHILKSYPGTSYATHAETAIREL